MNWREVGFTIALLVDKNSSKWR